MRNTIGIGLAFILFFFVFRGSAEARFKRYTYPYDIAEIEWIFLNWTADWRGSTTPAAPFILERMIYDRETKKANIYLSGQEKDAGEENLNKSLKKIVDLFTRRFPPEFDAKTDLIIHYRLKQQDGRKITYIKYEDGAFSRKELGPGDPQMQPDALYY